MLRISGVTIPNDKRAEIGLTYLFGIGKVTSNKILKQAQIDPNKRIKELTEEEENKLRQLIEKEYKIEGNLRRDVMTNIKRLKEIRSYRGIRHIKGLPCRGQRTKTNSRTGRGNSRKTAGSGMKKSNQKT